VKSRDTAGDAHITTLDVVVERHALDPQHLAGVLSADGSRMEESDIQDYCNQSQKAQKVHFSHWSTPSFQQIPVQHFSVEGLNQASEWM
jgi:hypothetical protein